MLKICSHLAIIAALLLCTPAWARSNSPQSVVENGINQIVKILKKQKDVSSITARNRDKIFHTVENIFDYPTIAKRSLSIHWFKLNKTERKRFLKVLRNFIKYAYSRSLSVYKGQRIKFEDTQIKKRKARIIAHVIDKKRKIPVEFLLNKTKKGWKVYDVIVLGTSMDYNIYRFFKLPLEHGGYQSLLQVLDEFSTKRSF